MADTKVALTVIEMDSEEALQKRGFIYVMKSFLIPKNVESLLSEDDKRRGYEDGSTILWGSMAAVEEYLDALREGRDDRPFECRWNYLVVEKVFFGPYSRNEVVGWWRAVHQSEDSLMGYDLIPLDKNPLPGAEACFNFTVDT